MVQKVVEINFREFLNGAIDSHIEYPSIQKFSKTKKKIHFLHREVARGKLLYPRFFATPINSTKLLEEFLWEVSWKRVQLYKREKKMTQKQLTKDDSIWTQAFYADEWKTIQVNDEAWLRCGFIKSTVRTTRNTRRTNYPYYAIWACSNTQ